MKNLNDISKQLGTWLKNLDRQERSGVEDVWQKTGQSDPAEEVSLSTEEKQSALANIKRELKLDKEQTPRGDKKTDQEDCSPFEWRWLAMAAALLIAAATSYLFIPREHTAPFGEQVSVKLPDNSTVTLNSGSSLTYNRLFGYFHRNAGLNGEAFFEVETGEEPFVVTTFNATVRVLGTKFNLRSWASDPGAETFVALTEGKLSFQSLETPATSVVLNPGESSSVQGDSATPTNPSVSPVDQTLLWMEGRLSFQNRPIGQIIRELERRYNLSIEVESTDILSDSLTIYYSNRIEAEQAIKDICLSKGVTYRQTNNGFVIEN